MILAGASVFLGWPVGSLVSVAGVIGLLALLPPSTNLLTLVLCVSCLPFATIFDFSPIF